MRKLFLVLILLIFISGCVKDLKEKTEIRVKQAGMEIVIAPSQDKTISGIVSIEATRVPEGTETIGFVIQGAGIPSMDVTGPNLGIDADGGDGWRTEFDTAVYGDGAYTLFVIAGRKTAGSPLGGAHTTIVIKNAGKDATKLEPPGGEIDFYKIVYLMPTDVSGKRLAEVKESGANVVGFFIMLDYQNTSYALPKGWDINVKSYIRDAYRNGLAVSLSVKYTEEALSKELPYREGSNIDLPPGYDLAAVRKNMKEIYKEIAIFAQENKVHSITHPAEIEEWIGRVYLDGEEYWAQTNKFNKEVGSEIRKHFKGKLMGNIMGGQWGFGAPCCYTNVPIHIADFSGFDGVIIGISGSTLGYVEEGLKRIDYAKKFVELAGGGRIICVVGAEGLGEGKTQTYNEFFEKSNNLVNGYITMFIPAGVSDPSPYDRTSIEVTKNWYKKLL